MKNFNLQCFLDCANELVRADEVASALWLLEKGIPGFWREKTPKEIYELKNEIMYKIATPSFYATHVGCEVDTMRDTYKMSHETLRGKAIIADVKFCNDNGLIPAIVDLGPGEMWLPKMLLHHGLRFTYKPIYVNHPTFEAHKKDIEAVLINEIPKDQPMIFYACEILEHLWEPRDIRFEMNRLGRAADIVHVSTPLNTFDVDCIEWRDKGDLGHLRTYTSKEFSDVVASLFPEYGLMFYRSQIQHARGVAHMSPFEAVKNSMGKDTIGPTLTKG